MLAIELEQVRHVIAVGSGKGGVGKSATAANLAVALAAEGAQVGLLDADIYGPSQPMMMGIPADQRPEVREQKYFLPIEAHGIQTMSMGYLVTEKTPMVWRGPMASGALTQMIGQTLWHELDYLVVDMPPGTGDIQLTLAQQVPVTASIIVTTPQDIALADVRKGIEMFAKVSIPCVGIVENMAQHTCSSCGHTEAIFGASGGDRIAEEYGVPVLGSLPLSLDISRSVDEGKPITIAQPESAAATEFHGIAKRVDAAVKELVQQRRPQPSIVVDND